MGQGDRGAQAPGAPRRSGRYLGAPRRSGRCPGDGRRRGDILDQMPGCPLVSSSRIRCSSPLTLRPKHTRIHPRTRARARAHARLRRDARAHGPPAYTPWSRQGGLPARCTRPTTRTTAPAPGPPPAATRRPSPRWAPSKPPALLRGPPRVARGRSESLRVAPSRSEPLRPSRTAARLAAARCMAVQRALSAQPAQRAIMLRSILQQGRRLQQACLHGAPKAEGPAVTGPGRQPGSALRLPAASGASSIRVDSTSSASVRSYLRYFK